MYALLAWVVGCYLGSSAARAEVVETNQAAKLYLRAGEQSRVVMSIKSGQQMTVLAKDGRWLKVRVKGRTGYVTRSSVAVDSNDVQRNTRRRPFVDGRSTGRTFGGEGPDDRVGGDATETDPEDTGGDEGDDAGDGDRKTKRPKNSNSSVSDDEDEDDPDEKSTSEDDDERARVTVNERVILRADPNKRSAKILTATNGDMFFLVEKRGKWSLLETTDGDKSGWILSRLHSSQDSAGPRSRVIGVNARLGVTLISQAMRSTGSQAKYPDNYNLQSSSLTLAIGGEYLRPYQDDYVLGAYLSYAGTKAAPGVAYKEPTTGTSTNISFSMHNAVLVAEGGYDFHSRKGMIALARVGFRYNAFFVDANNAANLPSEIFRGPVIGASLLLPKLTPTIGLRATVDALVLGTRKQTIGVEDGTSPSPFGLQVEVAGSYQWSPGLQIMAGYQLDYASTDFGAPKAGSKRMHMGTSVARTDLFHSITVGAGKSF
jgi:uncharacterized protein YgiM (DUF1202 family)